MTEGDVRRMTGEEILKAIEDKRLKYAPAWWQQYGKPLRRVTTDKMDIFLYSIESFQIGEETMAEGIYYLDGRILEVELSLDNKKGHPVKR